MNKLDADNLCSHGGDMLAYLYNEMATADRESFEFHLADCGTCIDEFAELSQSRYPVFEWKQIEFDPLPTPRVVIPVEATSVSWFEKLRASFVLRPTFAFGSLAAITVVASLAAFALMGVGGSGEIAGVDLPTITPSPEVTIKVPERAIETVPVVVDRKSEVRHDEVPRVVKASTSSKPTVTSVRPRATQQAKRSQPLPALNSPDEDEDDSLRLADIFEEIGTSES